LKTWKAVTYEGLLDPELIEFSWQKASEGKSKIYEWSKERFVDMLGMRTYRSKQVIRRNIYLKIRRLMDKVKKKRTPHMARSIMSYKGIVQHSDCIYLYKEMQRDIKRYKLKELVAV